MSEQIAVNTMGPGESRVVINCEPYLDISDAVAIHRELIGALERAREIEIDAAHVERIDTAVLQLFYGFITEARLRHLDVHWGQVSDAVQRSADTLGLRQRLGLP